MMPMLNFVLSIMTFILDHPTLILWWLVCTFLFWFMFANLMWIKRGIDEDRWSGWRLWLARLVGYPLAGFGIVYDVAYNYTWGSIMFWSFPRPGSDFPKTNEWTFTARLKRTKNREDWRGIEARLICKYLVEPNDPHHCGDYNTAMSSVMEKT